MSNEWPLWEVFIRGQHGLSHRHVGSLHAPDAEMAIHHARDVYTRRNEGVSIWVVKAAEITEPKITRQLVLATSTQRPMTQVTRSLTNVVTDLVKELVASGVWAPEKSPGSGMKLVASG